MKTFFNQQKPKCIEEVVLKYFIRELKLRKLYYLFFKEIPNASSFYYAIKSLVVNNKNKRVDKDFDKKYTDEHSPFKNSKTFNNIVEALVNLNSSIGGHHDHMMPSGMDSNGQIVSMTINHLIHFILECNMRNMDVFNSVGQSVFNNACNYLYGVEYTNEQNRIEEEQRKTISTPEGLRAILWRLYMDSSANGYKGSFDDFMANYNNFVQAQNDAMPFIRMGRPFSENPWDDDEDEDGDLPDWDVEDEGDGEVDYLDDDHEDDYQNNYTY